MQETLLRAWRHLDRLDRAAATGPAVAVHRRPAPGHRRPARPAGPARPRSAPPRSPRCRASTSSSTRWTGSVVDALDSLPRAPRRDRRDVLPRPECRRGGARARRARGTVKSRCYYALRALKLALAERGVMTRVTCPETASRASAPTSSAPWSRTSGGGSRSTWTAAPSARRARRVRRRSPPCSTGAAEDLQPVAVTPAVRRVAAAAAAPHAGSPTLVLCRGRGARPCSAPGRRDRRLGDRP